MTEWFRTWIAKVAKDFVTCFITKDRWKYIVKGLGNTLQIASPLSARRTTRRMKPCVPAPAGRF